ncbi:MAG: EAL domain-containing protein [Acholeplasmataceae bacterium]|nr:EAL domain-containing protein [Acholeplasmataceae bacterium]
MLTFDRKISNFKSIVLKVVILLVMFLVSVLVYFSGGTKSAISHLMYIPIVLSGFLFGYKWAFFLSLIGGLFLGPFMPLDVSLNVKQDLANWIIRTVVFVLLGVESGIAKNYVSLSEGKYNRSLYYHYATNIPNLNILKMLDENELEPSKGLTAVTVLILNYEKIVEFFTTEVYNKLISNIYNDLNNKISHKKVVLSNNSNKFWLLVDDNSPKDVVKEIRDIIVKFRRENEFSVYFEFSLGHELIYSIAEKEETLFYASTNKAYKVAAAKNTIIADKINKQYDYTLLSDLDLSLKDNDFFLVYQPLIPNYKTRTLFFEALIRWNHPERGLIPPNDFIPLVEETLLINRLTLWVLNKAIEKTKFFEEQGLDTRISINVSPRNIYSSRFIKSVIDIFNIHNVDPKKIEFEITEGTAMNASAETIEHLQQLKDLGVEIAIDDFGKGYSSIYYLTSFPISTVKIDRNFTLEILSNPRQKILIEESVNLLRKLGFDVICEGVETFEQLEIIQEMNVDYYQGYYFSKPLNDQDINNWTKNYCSILKKRFYN